MKPGKGPGQTALYVMVSEFISYGYDIFLHLKLNKTLLQNGADPNLACGKKNQTPLMLAAKGGVWEFVEMFLDHGANPDLQDTEGRTALMPPLHRSPIDLRATQELQNQYFLDS